MSIALTNMVKDLKRRIEALENLLPDYNDRIASLEKARPLLKLKDRPNENDGRPTDRSDRSA